MLRTSSKIYAGLLAGAAGLGFALPAVAQSYGAYGPPEEVTVTAPPLRGESTRLNGPLEKVSLSVVVPYSDLDLVTRRGALTLRARVRDAAYQTCAQLAQAYPVYELQGTSCIKTAMQNGLVRADEAIGTARQEYRYSIAYHY